MSAAPLTLEELDAEIEALDRVEEATVTLLNLKAGDALSEAALADLIFLDEYHRKEEDTAINTFHKGYECGIERAAGADTAKLIEERDGARASASIAEALKTTLARSAFIDGAQVCREMMARFVEGDPAVFSDIANSIRLNWRPSWGDDPGSPSENKYQTAAPCEISAKPVAQGGES